MQVPVVLYIVNAAIVALAPVKKFATVRPTPRRRRAVHRPQVDGDTQDADGRVEERLPGVDCINLFMS
jgi:hypothetical protein